MKEKTTKCNNKNVTLSDFEVSLASEIVRKAKRETKKWFSAWLLTAALLILSNALWYFAYNM